MSERIIAELILLITIICIFAPAFIFFDLWENAKSGFKRRFFKDSKKGKKA